MKGHIAAASLKYLNNLAGGHSKSIKLMKKKLKCSEYLKDNRFTKSEVQLLFKLRTRMFPVKMNFKNSHKSDLNCKLCIINVSDQEHQLLCPILKRMIPELSETDIKYQDLFGNIKSQLKFIKIYSKIERIREVLLDSLKPTTIV